MKISGLMSGYIVGSVIGRKPGEYLDLLPFFSLMLPRSLQWPNSTAD